MDNELPIVEIRKPFPIRKILNIFFLFCFLFIISYYAFSSPSINRSYLNKENITIHVAPNQTLSSISEELETKSVVRHAFVLKAFVTVLGESHGVEKGDYLFDKPMSVFRVAFMLAQGDHNIDKVKVTFKEGMTNNEMADLLSTKLPTFRRDLFMSDPRTKQGYLFPDTYFFFPQTSVDEILAELTFNFENKIEKLANDIEKSNRKLSDIIIMASLIEKEAKGEKDASIIAGILWNRLDRGMLLQVDAYRDTYKTVGLPRGPIANPGLVSIKAAIKGERTDYLYYLHAKDGSIYLAKTYEEHKRNINKYLK